MTDVKVPDGLTLIGWVGRDESGVDCYLSYPVLDASSVFSGGINRFDKFLVQAAVLIPHLHARPLFVGVPVDLTPVPAVEWVTRGELSIAECEGYSLATYKGTVTYAAYLRRDGVEQCWECAMPDLPATQSWAVSKARELARTAKGEM